MTSRREIMKILTLTTAAVLTLSLGVAPGTVLAQQTQQPAKPQQPENNVGLMGGGGSSKPNEYQTGSDNANNVGLMGGGGSAKPDQRQGGNASSEQKQKP